MAPAHGTWGPEVTVLQPGHAHFTTSVGALRRAFRQLAQGQSRPLPRVDRDDEKRLSLLELEVNSDDTDPRRRVRLSSCIDGNEWIRCAVPCDGVEGCGKMVVPHNRLIGLLVGSGRCTVAISLESGRLRSRTKNFEGSVHSSQTPFPVRPEYPPLGIVSGAELVLVAHTLAGTLPKGLRGLRKESDTLDFLMIELTTDVLKMHQHVCPRFQQDTTRWVQRAASVTLRRRMLNPHTECTPALFAVGHAWNARLIARLFSPRNSHVLLSGSTAGFAMNADSVDITVQLPVPWRHVDHLDRLSRFEALVKRSTWTTIIGREAALEALLEAGAGINKKYSVPVALRMTADGLVVSRDDETSNQDGNGDDGTHTGRAGEVTSQVRVCGNALCEVLRRAPGSWVRLALEPSGFRMQAGDESRLLLEAVVATSRKL
jgi:hypothetical protein